MSTFFFIAAAAATTVWYAIKCQNTGILTAHKSHLF